VVYVLKLGRSLQMVMLSDRQDAETTSPHGKGAALHAARTHDIDEQAALLHGWNQTYDQISAGAFEGALLEAQIDALRLFREITSNALYQTGALPRGVVAVGAPVTLRGNATFCGQACNGRQLHVFSGDDAFEFFSPSDLDIVGFVLTERDLCNALTPDEIETVLPSLARPHLRLANGGAVARMHRMFADICDVAANGPDLARDPKRVSAMAGDVAVALAAALVRVDTDGLDIPSARRARIVGDVRDLVSACPDDYTSVAELCRELGVSRRALQLSFQETLGIKPLAYLRAMRMNGARRSLKHASTVAEAATSWGFWHFGRFARDYKVMFGELPSETFRLHHGPGELDDAPPQSPSAVQSLPQGIPN